MPRRWVEPTEPCACRAPPLCAAFVVKSFLDAGDTVSGYMGLGFMILSMSVVWLSGIGSALGWLAGYIGDDSSMREFTCSLLKRAIPSMIATPVNLHTLYLGAAYASLQSKLKVVQAGLQGQAELWRNYDAALEYEKWALETRRPELIKAADKAIRDAKNALKQSSATKKYFEVLDDCNMTYALFVGAKAVETAFESVPLSMLTASAIFMPGDQSGFTGNEGLFYSSLALSILSMTYGFFGGCIGAQQYHANEDSDNENHTKGQQGKLFIALLVNVTYTLLTMGLCYGSPTLGPVRVVLPLLLMGLSLVIMSPPTSIGLLLLMIKERGWFWSKPFCEKIQFFFAVTGIGGLLLSFVSVSTHRSPHTCADARPCALLFYPVSDPQ